MPKYEYNTIEVCEGHTIIASKNNPDLPLFGMGFLLDAIQFWRDQNKTRIIHDVQFVKSDGVTRSVSIFWKELELPNIEFKIDNEVLDRYGIEYAEALAKDVSDFLEHDKHQDNVVAVVSKREVAVILNRRLRKSSVMLWRQLLRLLPPSQVDDIQRRYEQFQRDSDHGYFCLPLPDDFVVG
jgi:hypothetical protein